METTDPDLEFLRQLLTAHRAQQPVCERLAAHYAGLVKQLATDIGIKPVVSSRGKTLESVMGKYVRKSHAGQLDRKSDVQHVLSCMTDLCGVRAVVHTLAEVRQLAAAARKRFSLDETHSVDRTAPEVAESFGYRSVHVMLVVQDADLDAGWTERDRKAARDRRIELQVRTDAMHLWAELDHDLAYKSEFALPEQWKRTLALLAAQLEACDREFQRIMDDLSELEAVRAPFIPEKRRSLLARQLEVLHEIEPHNPRSIHRLVRLYLDLGGVQEEAAFRRLCEDEQSYLEATPDLQRDVGVAICKLLAKPGTPEYARGQAMLRAASRRSRGDADAICSLAGTWRKAGQYDRARRLYQKAFKSNPRSSYALVNYMVEEMVATHTVDVVNHLWHPIATAVRCCRRQITIGLNMPWALYDLGLYRLLQGKLDDPRLRNNSLACHARGMAAASSAWMIDTHLKNTILRLRQARVGIAGLEIVERLLRLGLAARFGVRPEGGLRCERGQKRPRLKPPVLILAGGCGRLDTARQAELGGLTAALRGFRGTIICGGTPSGIAGVAGALQADDSNGHLWTVGYLPSAVADQADRRYAELVYTAGADYSVVEPLSYWEDLLDDGVSAADVRLLGYNGGRVSAFEYRLALALGAKVALILGSGREADRLLCDPLWVSCPGHTAESAPAILEIGLGDVSTFIV